MGWLLAGLACLTAAPASAQPLTPGDADLATSHVYVFVGKSGLGHDHAVIGTLQSGHITLGAADRAGRIVIDLRTFRADTADARRVLGLPGATDANTQQQVNDNMLGPAVLDVARHPTATFDIRSAMPAPPAANGRPCIDLIGNFTLHGVTRPLSVRAETELVGPVVRLAGGFVIRQTDFGMKPFTKFGGVVGVADELRVYGDIRLHAQPAVLPSAASIPSTPAPAGVPLSR